MVCTIVQKFVSGATKLLKFQIFELRVAFSCQPSCLYTYGSLCMVAWSPLDAACTSGVQAELNMNGCAFNGYNTSLLFWGYVVWL